MLGIGETILYKLSNQGPKSHPEGNQGARWKETVFLGYTRSSKTFILNTDQGFDAARSMHRQPELAIWNSDNLAEIKATPWSERELPDVKVKSEELAAAEAPVETAAKKPTGGLRANAADLNDHGYTEGCMQCSAGAQRSKRYRERIIEAIGSSDAGRRRVEDHEERGNRFMADVVEKAGAPGSRPVPGWGWGPSPRRGWRSSRPEGRGPKVTGSRIAWTTSQSTCGRSARREYSRL